MLFFLAAIFINSKQVLVKNKYFTQTVNPSEMVLGDRTTLRTVIQNTDLEKPMCDVRLEIVLSGLTLRDNAPYVRK